MSPENKGNPPSPTRRSFIKGILGLGLLPLLPDVAEADEEELIRHADRLLKREPMHFLVEPGGTLELANYLPSADRFTAYDVSLRDLDFEEGASDFLDRIQALRYEIHAFVIDRKGEDALEDCDTDMILEAIELLSPEDRAALREELLIWFAGEVSLEERDLSDIVRPVDGRQWAFELFQHDIELDHLEALDIVVVEGDCPGSTYFAAELRGSIDEANRTAADLGLPITFARADREMLWYEV